MKETWASVRNATLTDQVYKILRDRILAGAMVPGDFVREQDVSAKLDVSRTPVREALGRLASEGFIERIPRRGFRVPEESVPGMIEFYPIICALEILAAEESFPQIDATDLNELREINDSYRRAFKAKEIARGISINHRFHHALSAKSQNRRLTRMLDDLRSQVESLEIWAFADIDGWEESIAEHESLLDAIEAGEFDKARAILEANRLTTYRDYQAEHWPTGQLEPTDLDPARDSAQSPGSDNDSSPEDLP